MPEMIPEKVLEGSVNGITEEGRHVLAMIFADAEGVKVRNDKILSLFEEIGARVDIDHERGRQHIAVQLPQIGCHVLSSHYNRDFASPMFLKDVREALAKLGVFPV